MQNAKRNGNGRNKYKGKERIITLVIARFGTAKILKAIEKTLYDISVFVDFFIVRPRLRYIHLWRNRIGGRLFMQVVPDFLCTIGFVTKDIAAF